MRGLASVVAETIVGVADCFLVYQANLAGSSIGSYQSIDMLERLRRNCKILKIQRHDCSLYPSLAFNGFQTAPRGLGARPGSNYRDTMGFLISSLDVSMMKAPRGDRLRICNVRGRCLLLFLPLSLVVVTAAVLWKSFHHSALCSLSSNSSLISLENSNPNTTSSFSVLLPFRFFESYRLACAPLTTVFIFPYRELETASR